MAENRSSGAKNNARNKATRTQNVQGSAKHSLRLTLEPRMVFDASVAATAIDVVDHTHDALANSLADAAARTAEPQDAAKAPAEPAPTGDGGADHGAAVNSDHFDQVSEAGAGAFPTPPDSASVLQLVFVDPRVEGAAEAVATLGAGTKVVTLDSGRDGIRQISEALSGTSGLQAIHILAPGADGSVTVGRDSLTTAALTGRADEVASWRDHLADGAGITLHGADTAGSAKGQLLARTLADLTGAGVSSTDDLQVQDAHAADTTSVAERRIVVIDARVEDAETLLGDLPADVERLVVGAGDDGIALIQRALQGGDVSSLQIVAHGSPGSLTLGRDVLNTDALAGTAGEAIAAWRPSFTEDADILLLGCEVGQGDGGALFLSRLAALTGADIAASDDPTGSADLGGDWVLEKTVGTVESGIAMSGRAQADWHGLLADPVVTNSGGPTRTVVEDTSTPIIGISVSDADPADTLTVTLNVSNGTLSLTPGSAAVAYANGSKTATVSGSAAAVNAALATLTYTPAANSNAADLLRVLVGDGTTTTTLTPDIAIAITPVNDAPTLTRGAQLTTMTEGDTNPAGTLVTAILAGSGYADAESGALQGIAIVGTNTTQGTWWYSSDGGANWLSMGARSDQNALLLAGDAGTMIRFIPATDFNGTAWIQYRAWDRTSGTAGSTVDLSDPATLGGDTAFSAERQLGTVAVAAVNDAPTLFPSAANVDEGRGNRSSWTTPSSG